MVVVVGVNTGSSVAGILVNRVLHLAQKIVEMDEILLCAGVGHGQVVLLSERVLRRCWAAMDHRGCMLLRHVLLRGSHGTVGDGQ